MSEYVTPELEHIASIHPEAIQVRGIDLRKGDKVFDALGDTHELVNVRGPLANGAMSFKRADYPVREYIDAYAPITILRPAPIHRCGTPLRPSTQEDMTVTPETHTDEYPWTCPRCLVLVRGDATTEILER